MQNQEIDLSPEQILFYDKLNSFYDSYFLTSLQRLALTKYIKVHFAKKTGQVDRLRSWLLAKINQTNVVSASPWQKGCPDIIPGLRAKPWWDENDLPWLSEIESHYSEIRDQVLLLRQQGGFQPYRGPSWISDKKAEDGVGYQSVDSGQWNVFYLQLHNMKFQINCQRLPITMGIINKYIPNNYHHSMISALTENGHIMKHYGPTNKKLRFHLPLIGVQDSKLRVGDEIRKQQAGKAYVFDDSFEHEAWHQGKQTRIILIVDFWHPDLTQIEIRMLKVLQNALFKAEQVIGQMDQTGDNFYTIIESAKELLKDNQWWVVK